MCPPPPTPRERSWMWCLLWSKDGAFKCILFFLFCCTKWAVSTVTGMSLEEYNLRFNKKEKRKKKMASHYKYVISYKLAGGSGGGEGKSKQSVVLNKAARLWWSWKKKNWGEWPGKVERLNKRILCQWSCLVCPPSAEPRGLWLLRFVLISWFRCPFPCVTSQRAGGRPAVHKQFASKTSKCRCLIGLNQDSLEFGGKYSRSENTGEVNFFARCDALRGKLGN